MIFNFYWTHPDIAALVDPLSATVGKRVKTFYFFSPSLRSKEGAGGELTRHFANRYPIFTS